MLHIQVALLDLKSDSDKLRGESFGRPTGWSVPIAGLGWAILRGGGLFDGSADEGEHGLGDKKVMKEKTANKIIEDIIEKIIISKDGVGDTDEEVTCEELPEVALLDQPGEGWKKVVDGVFQSQDGGNINVRIFSVQTTEQQYVPQMILPFHKDNCHNS